MKSQWLNLTAVTFQSALIALLVIFISSETSNAAAPQLINYQARLNDTSGNPLDTTVDVVFTVYNHPTANNVLWSESYGGLTITDGNLSVLLGSVATLPDTLFKGTDCYLGIKVGTDTEISPRNRLASVPYAFRLESVDGAKAGDLSGALSLIVDETKALGDALLVKNQAGEVLFSVKLGPLGAAEMSIFDPVDSKDGNLAVTKRVEITAEGIVMFDTTGTDTSMTLTSTGDISGTGQITV
ncbi:MAG TPA: hypothetical protein VHP63_04175, partial [candidate division Zixibacteria bacterium]|nr:hypothetical protein [candidate division Zixibacteria bacterium]